MALFQGWIPGFDPRRPTGLTVPVWITLRLLPLEYLDFAREIAGQVEKVLDEDHRVTVTQDPRFYVEMELDKGWIASLQLPNLLNRPVEVIIDYDDPMCCKSCFDPSHESSLCPSTDRPRVSPQAPSRPNHRNQDSRGKQEPKGRQGRRPRDVVES